MISQAHPMGAPEAYLTRAWRNVIDGVVPEMTTGLGLF